MQAVQADSFVQKVLSSGLLSAPQCAELSRAFSNDASCDDAAAYLVERHLLTAFQAAQLASGRTKLVLGQYHILDELGRGGFGCVYKARHTLMDRLVALKVIAAGMIEDSKTRANFRREVLATTRLTHPNIVMAFDANEVDGILFFVMEYVDGMNLHQFVKKHGPLAIRLASELLVQVAQGLQYAHEQGLVHRDIKPPNLLIPRQAVARLAGRPLSAPDVGTVPVLVKVVDFGLARLCGASSDVATVFQSEHGFRGTPGFVAPEQARNSHAADIRSDLYSLGCTLYFALTGSAPFRGTTSMEVIVQHLEKTARPIEQVRPETPPLLASVLRRLMAKDPNKRFQTPAELLAEVRFFLGSRAAGEHDPPHVASVTSSRTPVIQEVRKVEEIKDVPLTMRLPTFGCLVSVGAPPPAEPRGAEATEVSESPESPQASPAALVTVVNRGNLPLPELWNEWIGVIETGVTGLKDEDYRLLHESLLFALHQRFLESTESHRDACLRLVALVQPWLNLEAIRKIDDATRADLEAKCRQLGETLGLSSSRWGLRLTACAILLILVSSGIAWAISTGFTSHVPTFSWSAIESYLRAHPVIGVTMVAPAVLAIGLVAFACFRLCLRVR